MCLFRLKLILFMLLHFIRFLSVKIYVKDGIEKKRTEIKRKIKKKTSEWKEDRKIYPMSSFIIVLIGIQLINTQLVYWQQKWTDCKLFEFYDNSVIKKKMMKKNKKKAEYKNERKETLTRSRTHLRAIELLCRTNASLSKKFTRHKYLFKSFLFLSFILPFRIWKIASSNRRMNDLWIFNGPESVFARKWRRREKTLLRKFRKKGRKYERKLTFPCIIRRIVRVTVGSAFASMLFAILFSSIVIPFEMCVLLKIFFRFLSFSVYRDFLW